MSASESISASESVSASESTSTAKKEETAKEELSKADSQETAGTAGKHTGYGWWPLSIPAIAAALVGKGAYDKKNKKGIFSDKKDDEK